MCEIEEDALQGRAETVDKESPFDPEESMKG
jgi:hypothetical protein